MQKEKLPRVTHIIDSVTNKPALMFWYGKLGLAEAKREMKISQLFGTEVHDAIKAGLYVKDYQPKLENVRRIWHYQKNPKPNKAMFIEDILGKIFNCQRCALRWLAYWGLKPELTEHHVINYKHLYQGTFDLLARQEKTGELWLVDFKTGGIYISHKIQLSAYKHAYELMYKEKINKMRVVSVGKGNSKSARSQNVDTDYFDLFICCLKLYRGGIGR